MHAIHALTALIIAISSAGCALRAIMTSEREDINPIDRVVLQIGAFVCILIFFAGAITFLSLILIPQ